MAETTVDELRVDLLQLLRDELELSAVLQGKRIIVRDGDAVYIVLVTAAKVPSG